MNYYERSIGAEPRIWDELARLIVYVKIPFAIIVVELISGKSDSWRGTQIDMQDRLLIDEVAEVPSYVCRLVSHYYGTFLESKTKMSSAQFRIIARALEKADRNSGSFKTAAKNFREK